MYIKWDDIKKYDKCISVNFQFHRDDLVQYMYSSKINNDGNKKFINSLKSSNNPFTLTYAKYPYYFEPGLVHIILWLHSSALCDNIKFVEKIIREILPQISKDKIAFFQNSKNNRSIKDIHHYHIIVNMKETGM